MMYTEAIAMRRYACMVLAIVVMSAHVRPSVDDGRTYCSQNQQ